MRPALPEKLGWEFAFSLFMIILCFSGMAFGLIQGWGYRTSVGGFLGIFYVYRLISHVRKVRLAREFKSNPEIAKIYYGRKH